MKFADTGAIRVLKFPFVFNTAAILTGATVYTPTIGDVLLDAWFEIDTAWDGTTPIGDLGTFVGGGQGWLRNILGAQPIDMTQGDSEQFNWDPSILSGSNAGSIAALNALYNASALLNAAGGASPFAIQMKAGVGLDYGARWLPAKFTAATPIKVVVSQDGELGAKASIHGDVAPTLPVTIATGVNDTFVWTPNATIIAETFTVAPGTYTTLADCDAAMGAAIGATSGEAFSTLITVTDDTELVLTSVAIGIIHNADLITDGNGAAAAFGFTSPSANSLIDGHGGDPGSTVGAAILYLVVATPVAP